MLWYRFWLETRWRVLLPMAMSLMVLAYIHYDRSLLPLTLAVTLPVFFVLGPIALAGSGIMTETPFRAVKGIQESVNFTLSLPASRTRLLATRAAFGMLETAAIVAAVGGIAWLVFPELRQRMTGADGVRYMVTIVIGSWALYGLSTLFSTILDAPGQIFATIAAVYAAGWLNPRSGHIARAMAGSASPLLTHALPWASLSTSLAIGLACFVSATKVVRFRQY